MQRNSLFWGSAIILLGLVLLANQFFPALNAWNVFWPLLLIFLGVWFLFGRRIPAANLVTEPVNVPLADIQEARILFHHGAGKLLVSPAAQQGALLEGSFSGGVEQHLERSGFAARLDLRAPANAVFVGWPGGYFNEGLKWDVRLSREIPLQLEVETGASETRLDLQELRVTELRLKTGASSTVVHLPAGAGFTRVSVISGAASVELNVPQGVAGRIRVQSGLAGVQIDPNRFPSAAGGYETPGFEDAANKVEIQVETGVASFTVR